VTLEGHEITIFENVHVIEYLFENIETAIPTEALDPVHYLISVVIHSYS